MRMNERLEKFRKKAKEELSMWVVLLLMLLFVVVYLANRIFITIGPGEAGVLWRRFAGGTVVEDVYSEGMQYIFPWDRMYIYSIRIQQTAHEFDVLTRSGLKIHLLISIRYAPEAQLLGVLHQKVGPDYVQRIVIPEIEAVLRELIGRLEAEEVYTTDQAILEKSLNVAIERVAQRYVNIDNVIIKRIFMPPMVEEAIQQKIQQKHIAEAHRYKIERERLELERKKIEAQGFQQFNQILASSLSEQILRWRGIQAALELATSPNSKVVVIGGRGTEFQLFGDIPLGFADESTPLTAPAASPISAPPVGEEFRNTPGEPELPAQDVAPAGPPSLPEAPEQ